MFGKKKIFGHNNLFGQLALLLIQLEFLTFFSTDRAQDTLLIEGSPEGLR